MKRLIMNWCSMLLLLSAGCLAGSCGMITDDLDDCPDGLYVTFKYDYNLQRTDLFANQVGEVTLYVFDADGKLVTTREEGAAPAVARFAAPSSTIHITDLAPGKYRLVALAGQRPYADMAGTGRAAFIRPDMQPSSDISSLGVRLEGEMQSDGLYHITNNGLPLDTLWHGMTDGTVEVYDDYSNRASYVTVSLVRDTKKIKVSLRELDDPTAMDIADYDIRITDANSHLRWDNTPDMAVRAVYTPYETWNSYDMLPSEGEGDDGLELVSYIANAGFMTSRLVLHGGDGQSDGRLQVYEKQTGNTVADMNLPALLSRLRVRAEGSGYSEQEFLDRACDYEVEVWLRGGRPEYVDLGISDFGWSVRINYDEL